MEHISISDIIKARKKTLLDIFTDDVELYAYKSIIELMHIKRSIYDMVDDINVYDILSKHVIYDGVEIHGSTFFVYYKLHEKYTRYTDIVLNIDFGYKTLPNRFNVFMFSDTKNRHNIASIIYYFDDISLLQNIIRSMKLNVVDVI